MAEEKRVFVAPSILSGDFANMGKSVALLDEWGADLVHCDVMDGVYVPNITFGMPMIKAIKEYTKLPLDVHLMIVKPEKYLTKFIDSGADWLSFHPEVSDNPVEALKIIRDSGTRAGIVINADVKCEDYLYLLDLCDFILVMSVQAGHGGQKFIPETLKKVEAIKNYRKKHNLSFDIEIDGGINEQNAGVVRDTGVNVIVAGSAVYNSKNPERTIKIIRGDM
jgi:ribulose-phosphate 3-epimerase